MKPKNLKKCKHCKKEFKAIHGLQKYCFDEECSKVWFETEAKNQWKVTKKKMKEDEETVQSLSTKLQPIFNEFIRLRDKGKPCVSCDKPDIGKRNASHYYSVGSFPSVRFNENNVHASCVRCNKELRGNLLEYQPRLTNRIGEHAVFELHELAHKERKYTREELRYLIELYKKKTKELKNI